MFVTSCSVNTQLSYTSSIASPNLTLTLLEQPTSKLVKVARAAQYLSTYK
jgi:hypothetical protein